MLRRNMDARPRDCQPIDTLGAPSLRIG